MRAGILWLAVLVLPADSRAQTSRFVCVPESTFSLGPARVGELGPSAVARLGTPLAVRADTIEGADQYFPVTRYRYADFEITVSQLNGRVAEVRALTNKLSTPLGLHLGRDRAAVEHRFPAGSLRKPSIRTGPDTLQAYACPGLASTVDLTFTGNRLSGLLLHGFYPNN